jgi:hypothetical protein
MATDDFFLARLDGMLDLRHPLAVLAPAPEGGSCRPLP